MRFSLGFVLAISLAGLQFVAIITVVLTSYFSSEAAMLTHARSLLSKAGSASVEHSIRFLEPAADAADLSSRMVENGIVDAEDPENLETFLFQQLLNVPQISGVYYGDESGNFVFVMRDHEKGNFRTKIVRNEEGARTTELIWRNTQFEILERAYDNADRYDPRTRPWYANAKSDQGHLWTEPYIFFSSQEPGISVSAPVFTDAGDFIGAIGVDIEIVQLSSFLRDLDIGQNGQVVLLDEDGHVIAHPDPRSIIQNHNGTLSFAHISQIEDAASRVVFAELFQNGAVNGLSNDTEFQYGGETYLMTALPFQGIKLPWKIAIFAPENDFIQDIKANRLRNTWIAAAISLVTAIAGLALAELILRPVRAFAVRTALVSQGEVLASEPLPRTYRELQKANQTLIDEIAQRRLSEHKVQELSRDLVHFSRVDMMGQMATGLAHELSQPLTAITQNLDTATTIAEQLDGDTTGLLDVLGDLNEQAHRSGDVIHALRGLVRKDEETAETFDIVELSKQTRRLMRQEAAAHGVKITSNDKEQPAVRGNRVQIAQVLINLMRNAIDAMATENSPVRKIHITFETRPKALEVQVSDTGPGIDPNVTLFKRFETSKPDGLGLGLTISKSIVEANGGKIWYESKGLENGRFCFTLPY